MIKWVIIIAFTVGGEDLWIESHHAPIGKFAYYDTEKECVETLGKMRDEILDDFMKVFDFIIEFDDPTCEQKNIISKRFPEKPGMEPMIEQTPEQDI
jgi:hypothetical protein